jgi:hypothetical protein
MNRSSQRHAFVALDCSCGDSYTRINEGIYQAVWEETLTLDKMDLKHASYFVIVEERDLRLPATYASEPVSPERAIGKCCDDTFDEGLLIESGHRFFAKIPIYYRSPLWKLQEQGGTISGV